MERRAAPAEGATPFDVPAGVDRAELKSAFSRRLRHLMLSRRPAPWNQSDLARAAGLGRDAISTYIAAKRFPDPISFKKIADAFGLPPENMLPEMAGAATGALRGGQEAPAVSLMHLASHPGRMWLRVNRMVTLDQAADVLKVLGRDGDEPA
jgi:transcriptional regulator with XRE-family HTH domain